MSRIAILGSRDYPYLAQVHKYVLELPKDTTVLSGGARGVDREGELAAMEVGFPYITMFADWKTHGKAVGIIRTKELVKQADKVVVFWDGKSRGSMFTIAYAKELGKPLDVFTCRRHPKGITDNNGMLKSKPKHLCNVPVNQSNISNLIGKNTLDDDLKF